MNILPRIKNYKQNDATFIFLKNNLIYFDNLEECIYGKSIIDYLQQLYNEHYEINFATSNDINNSNIIAKKIENSIKEYYEIQVLSNKILIYYSDKLSLRNAFATIVALILIENNNLFIKTCYIKDYPESNYRSFLIDIARKYINIDELKLQIRTLALAKFNKIHWHLCDTERYAIKSEVCEYKNPAKLYKRYSIEEMREIVDYAKKFGLDSIPELDFPAHSCHFINSKQDISCIANGKSIGNYVVCFSNEKTYEFIDLLISELCTIFPYEYVHMGGDELSFYDLKDINYWPEWDNCDRCKALSKKENLNDTDDKYKYCVKQIYKILQKHNKKMIIWNDSIDISKKTDLPKDILIQFWRIALPTRGPSINCTLQKFLEQGFQVINAFFEETYLDDYVKEDRLEKWNPYNNPIVEDKYLNNIIGGEMCTWSLHNHFDYSIYSAIFYFSDRLWNKMPVNDKSEIYEALNIQTVSHDVNAINIFKLLNFGIFPLNDYDKYFYDKTTKDLTKIESAILFLTKIKNAGWGETKIVSGYITVFQEIRNNIYKERGLLPPDTTRCAYLED